MPLIEKVHLLFKFGNDKGSMMLMEFTQIVKATYKALLEKGKSKTFKKQQTLTDLFSKNEEGKIDIDVDYKMDVDEEDNEPCNVIVTDNGEFESE